MSGRIRVRLDIAYVGARFSGWQEQPQHRTVQGEIKREVSYLVGRPVTVTGAGRTDTGVNARGQVAHLDLASHDEFERIERALDRRVPDDIRIVQARIVSPSFHAIRSATARLYHYHLLLCDDLFRPYAWPLHWKLDRERMDASAAVFCGEHDFSSFCKTSSLKDDGNRCRLDLCTFDWSDDSAILRVRGNRFLHHMVRILAGTLVEIGRGVRPARDATRILAARDRSEAGCMAPAAGLFLEEVSYPEILLDPGYREPDDPNVGTEPTDSDTECPTKER